MLRWSWIGVLAGLVVLAVLLAWADSTVFRPAFPAGFEPPRRGGFRPPPTADLPFTPFQLDFRGFGRIGGLFTFWWFLSVGAGLIAATLGVLATAPLRVRRAAQRVRMASLPVMLAAGVATVLLGLALTVLLRVTFVLLALVPVVWGVWAISILFGEAALVLAFGRWLRTPLGPAPPLVGALAALLVLVDLALVPGLGLVFLVVVAVMSLGLAVLTRMGSPSGWSFEELNW